ncbi:hypothetical protein [Streptomyces sp. NPDC001500]
MEAVGLAVGLDAAAAIFHELGMALEPRESVRCRDARGPAQLS